MVAIAGFSERALASDRLEKILERPVKRAGVVHVAIVRGVSYHL